jgi:transposase InsO family protein
LTINVQEAEKLSLEQIQAFLTSSEGMHFAGEKPQQVYSWMERVLGHQQYDQQGRGARGLLRRYIVKITGLSRAQVTRLIRRYLERGKIAGIVYQRHRFAQRYTRADVELLASVDEAHETLSGPATRRVLQREYQLYGQLEFQRLAGISVAHLYNLRKQQRYRERRLTYTKTRPTQVMIGERRRPDPQGQPGFLRLDTVHQGDHQGDKGLYHINAVDEVTQWEIVTSTPRISELWLEPVWEDILGQFPFRILGFHTDNGSEFINALVAKLLQRLLIAQTKSRPRRSNDNGLVETKNGAVIRKHIGYGYIAAAHAELLQSFYVEHLNPYLNFHRPCAQPEIRIDEKGRRQCYYRLYQTPLETLMALPNAAQYLRPGMSLAILQRMAEALSDTEAARRMQQAKQKLFAQLHPTAEGRWK